MRGIPYFRAMFYRKTRSSVADDCSRGQDIHALKKSESEIQAVDMLAVGFPFKGTTKKMDSDGEEDRIDMHRLSPQKDERDLDGDHRVSDTGSDVSLHRQCSSPIEDADNESARQYEDSEKRKYAVNLDRENSFTDLEVASGHVSDPGVNRMKELESLMSSPVKTNAAQSEERERSETQLISLGAFSESGSVKHHDNFSTTSGRQALVLSYETSSVGGEARDFARGASVQIQGSPNSDGACRYGSSISMFKLDGSSQAMEAQKKKPWWKTFMVSLRNVHRDESGGLGMVDGNVVRISSVNGYVSDVEARGGRGSLSVLNERVTDNEREEENSGRMRKESSPVHSLLSSTRVGERPGNLDVEERPEIRDMSKFGTSGENPFNQADDSASNLKATVPIRKAATYPKVGKESSHVDDWVQSSRKLESQAKKTGSSRVEEWLSSVPAMEPSFFEEQEQQVEAEENPSSPTAPAAPHFENPGRGSVAESQHWAGAISRGDVAVDPDVEMAKMVMRAVNPLSTVAHFSGVGLTLAPCLGMFTNLKTLNLSANSIVRIAPGCLPKSLHSLDISRNSIVVIEGLRELTRLRVLNMSFNRVSRIGNGLSSCTSLKEIYLAGNKISEVEGLRRLSKLVVLDLSFNKLTTTKSLARVSVNYESLQALNVLGNAVHTNLGDEQLRRYVTYLCPALLYLNKQPLKPVSNREALGRELKATVKPAPRGGGNHHSHRKNHSSGGVKTRSGERRILSPALGVQDDGHHRKSHRRTRSSSAKELPKGFVPLPPTTADSPSQKEQHRVKTPHRVKGTTMARVKSDGALFQQESHWSPTAEPRGVVHSRMR